MTHSVTLPNPEARKRFQTERTDVRLYDCEHVFIGYIPSEPLKWLFQNLGEYSNFVYTLRDGKRWSLAPNDRAALTYTIYFRNPEDALLFKLTFS